MAGSSSAVSLASIIDKNYLECSICSGSFNDPRALPCLHPFCCGCLETWAKAYSKDGKMVNCPLCKKVYRVPEEGIRGFPVHFLVADLQSTVDKAKQKSSIPDLCENHGEKKAYYCENCDCAACSDCGMLYLTHRGHSFVRLKNTVATATSAAFSAKKSPRSPGRSQPTLITTKTRSVNDLTHSLLDSKATPVQSSHLSLFSGFSQPAPSSQPRRKWKESGVIKTSPKAEQPRGIAVHPNGDIAVTSVFAPVTVFSQNGDFKHVIKGSPCGIFDIAITQTSNQYIIPGRFDSYKFYIYNDTGVRCKTIKTESSSPWSVAVDSTGRIIAGFNEDKTVSIHHPDRILISKFQTQLSLLRLTCTPDDRLVISFENYILKVMDQSGHNASIIQPPPGIQSWRPMYVCCSKQGELFVGNVGVPQAVHRYLCTGSEYMYLDCIGTFFCRFGYPNGIALSADEEKLFVVDEPKNVIKIFE